MDETTVLMLTAKLLESCNLHKGNSIFSVIAEMDRKPANLHRLFSNILANQPLIIEVASDILGNEEIRNRKFGVLREKYKQKIGRLKKECENLRKSGSREEMQKIKSRVYCYERILDDMDYFFEKLKVIEPLVGGDVSEIKTDKPAAHLALLSHTYLISYNFPPQPFVPYSANACQHVEFFNKVDYFDFKQMFSEEEKAHQLRKALLKNEKAWSREVDPNLEREPIIRKRMEEAFGKPFDSYAMIKAMIERLGELAPGVGYEPVQKAVRERLSHLGCKEMVHSDRERWFLVNLENEIEKTIQNFL